MAVAGAIIGAVGSLAQGAFGMMQANYQAEVAKNNQKIAQWNARRASQVGGIEAQMKDMENAQLLGEQEVAQAASGVAISGRSQLRTRNMTRLYADADRRTIRENANLERYNHLVEATNFKAEAKSHKASGVASMIGGILGAAGDIAGGFDSFGGKKSMVGGAKPSPKATIRPPIPRPRPIMPSIGFNPLLRNKYNFGH